MTALWSKVHAEPLTSMLLYFGEAGRTVVQETCVCVNTLCIKTFMQILIITLQSILSNVQNQIKNKQHIAFQIYIYC